MSRKRTPCFSSNLLEGVVDASPRQRRRGEELPLGLGNPEPIPGVLDVRREVFHDLACFSVGRM